MESAHAVVSAVGNLMNTSVESAPITSRIVSNPNTLAQSSDERNENSVPLLTTANTNSSSILLNQTGCRGALRRRLGWIDLVTYKGNVGVDGEPFGHRWLRRKNGSGLREARWS
ncbi:hypothetical protein NE237_003502 [Protea cynaroides]|uniref:Uncharacterized protein n=1 Tax=Protea cynaroides TaxID=273540 RepID=A0A9Q0KGY1_9MAGN|nr:hypothetical protein NE237_003502 [Protea cynaroides]